MRSKTFKQGLATGLTSLATAMLCQSTATYASDIQIYKAPTTGGASLMFVLDLSGSMSQDHYRAVNKDFFNELDCTTENNQVSTQLGGVSYTFPGKYCYVTEDHFTDRVELRKTVRYEQIQYRSSGNWYDYSFQRISSNEPLTGSPQNLSSTISSSIVHSHKYLKQK